MSYIINLLNNSNIKDKKYKCIRIHALNEEDINKFKNIYKILLKKYKMPKNIIDFVDELKPKYKKEPENLFENIDWLNMPTYENNEYMVKSLTLYLIYEIDNNKILKFLNDLSKEINLKITKLTNHLWYPKRPDSLNLYNDQIFITDEKINPKYPIYIISKGRWENRFTSKYLEWADIPYKIVVEPQEYEEYSKVIDKSKILILPNEYLGKNQGSIPARNFVLHHSKKNGDNRHWLLDDNIKEYRRLLNNNRVIVKSGVVFKAVEDYVDRYTNIMLAGHNYYMFGVSTQINLKPITKNTRIYSSILINNNIPFEWRGKYNEDTDLSLRVLKAGYPTILFNAFLANKCQTLTQKGGNTDTIYNVDNALLLKAQSLAQQHPDVAKVKERFGRIHHYVNYNSFKELKPEFKKDVKANLTNKDNNYNMKLINKNDALIINLK